MKEDYKEKRPVYLSPLFWAIIATALVAVFGVWAAFQPVCSTDFWGNQSCSGTKWAAFVHASPNEIGDTLAGFAGALAFVWLIATVVLQGQELKEQRKEFEKMNETMSAQRFEATFFEMLSANGEIVNSIDLIDRSNGAVTRGRDCFTVFYTRLNKIYHPKLKKGHTEEQSREMAYTAFWNNHQLELGHYFRFLLNFFRFLSETGATDYHARLIKSQLSDQELLVLFYNCFTPHGSEFLVYAAKFALFDKLPTVRLLDQSHAELIDASCFGDNPMLSPSDMKHSINKPRDIL